MMVERKLFKTKLCQLYQQGSCRRQSCSFAHGDKELRGFGGSFNGRRDYRSVDLRDKLDRRHSPPRRYSPRRDAKGRQAPHGYYSPTSSLGERSDRKRRKKDFDGQSDFSGSAKILDEPNGRPRDRKQASSDSKGVLQEQLRNLRSEVDVLDNHKSELEMYLEERTQEIDSLSSQIQELEMQLSQEKEECKRVTSKIKKFIKAHHRYSRLQDELKRSQEKLQKLGDQLGSDVRSGANEEDSSINILSDGDTAGKHRTVRSLSQLQENSPPNKRVLRKNPGDAQTKPASLMKGDESMTASIGLQKASRWNVQHARSSNNIKKSEIEDYGRKGKRSLVREDVPRRGKTFSSSDVPSAEKVKGSEPGLLLPPTSMAAHAADELETADEEALDTDKAPPSKQVEKGATFKDTTLPFQLPPPPPLPVNKAAILQYHQAEAENVNEDEAEEMVHVDIV